MLLPANGFIMLPLKLTYTNKKYIIIIKEVYDKIKKSVLMK